MTDFYFELAEKSLISVGNTGSQELVRRLGRLLAACRGAQLAATLVLEATALLRLYAALRGIAGKANIVVYGTM
jgi:hypothetical protein